MAGEGRLLLIVFGEGKRGRREGLASVSLMETAFVPLDIMEKYILPIALDDAWDGMDIGPVVAFATLCTALNDVMFGRGNLERKRALWSRLLRANARENFYLCRDNRSRMGFPQPMMDGLAMVATSDQLVFPSLLVQDKGMRWVLKSRFRHAGDNTVGVCRYHSPLLVIEGTSEGGRPLKMANGPSSFVDCRGRYGEGTCTVSLISARNDWGMRTYVSCARLVSGQ